jgi:hypothetical protein
MDEMKMLQDRHNAQPSPSPEAIAQARARLIAHTRPESRRRRRTFQIPRLSGPAMAGLGLTSTAAAVALAVAISGTTQRGPGGSTAKPDTELSASQVLLAAAHQAEVAPTTGGYWHVKERQESSKWGQVIYERWTRRNGQSWIGSLTVGGTTPGQLTAVEGSQSFSVCGGKLTFGQLQALPTDPAALKAWMFEFAQGSPKDSPLNAAGQSKITLPCLIQLLASVPVTPKVRATAYRALAASQYVQRTPGQVKDGLGRSGIEIVPSQILSYRLIIDPKTSFVLQAQDELLGPLKRLYVEVGWTNEKPHVPTP